MSDDIYTMPEIQALLDTKLKASVDTFVEKLVALRKRETPLVKAGVHQEPGVHENPAPGVTPHTEPGGHEKFALDRVQPAPVSPVGSSQEPVDPVHDSGANPVTDPCPTCGKEDIPGECICLGQNMAKSYAWEKDPKKSKMMEGHKRKGNFGIAEKVKEKIKSKHLGKDGSDIGEGSGYLAQPEGGQASSGLALSELEHAGKPDDTEQNSGKLKVEVKKGEKMAAEPLCKLCKGAVLCKTHMKSEPAKKAEAIIGHQKTNPPASPGIVGMPKIAPPASVGVIGTPKFTAPASVGVVGMPKVTAPASVGIAGMPKIAPPASPGVIGNAKQTGSVKKGEVFNDPKHADEQVAHQKEAVEHPKGRLPTDKMPEEMSTDSEEMSEEGSRGGEETSASDRGHEEESESDMSKSGLAKKAPPGFSEKTMHELKDKYGTESAFKIAWAAHNKTTKKMEADVDDPTPGIDWKKSESGNMHAIIGDNRYRVAKSDDGFAAYHNGKKIADMKKSEDALAKANEHYTRKQVIEKAFYKSAKKDEGRGSDKDKEARWHVYQSEEKEEKSKKSAPVKKEEGDASTGGHGGGDIIPPQDGMPVRKSKKMKKAGPGEVAHTPSMISPDASDDQNRASLQGTPQPSEPNTATGPDSSGGTRNLGTLPAIKSEGMKKALPGKSSSSLAGRLATSALAPDTTYLNKLPPASAPKITSRGRAVGHVAAMAKPAPKPAPKPMGKSEIDMGNCPMCKKMEHPGNC